VTFLAAFVPLALKVGLAPVGPLLIAQV